ncbi:MAG: hypothetical protein AB7H43_11505 [Acidimicrobiia bacterium]
MANGRRRHRRARVLVLLGAALLVVSPMLRATPSDGLPLSDYPMFAPGRGRIARVPVVVGIDRGGGARRLDPGRIAATDEVMLAAKTVLHAVGDGRAATAALCRDVAGRIDVPGVEAVEVRTEVYDVVSWYEGDRAPIDVDVHHRCAVDR